MLQIIATNTRRFLKVKTANSHGNVQTEKVLYFYFKGTQRHGRVGNEVALYSTIHECPTFDQRF
jgi:hypothetical protein